MVKISRKSKEEILESQKELKSHRSGVKIDRPEGYQEYKEILSEMSPSEREHERKLRIQESKGMSQFHTGGAGHPFQAKKEYAGKGLKIPYTERKEMREYLTPKEQKQMDEFVEQYQGQERAEIEARLKGYHSAAERKEIRTRIGRETQHEAEKRYQEQHYDPAGRYKETVGAVKYKLGIVKEDIKKLATPAGLAGGIIGVVSPKMTLKEKITAEREKIAKEQKLQKRREILEKRGHELAVASAYGGIRPTKQKSRPRPTASQVYLGGFGVAAGGFSLGGRPQRPMQKVVSRKTYVKTQPQVVEKPSEPFGLSQYSGMGTPVQRPAPRPIRQTPTKRIVITERPVQRAEYRTETRSTNPVNDTSGNFLVDMGGMGSGNSPVAKRKKTTNDPTGAGAFW